MKSEDLMLNDWVLTPEGEPAQVYQIYNGIVALTAPSPNLYNVECLQPIKLTPELLEKNGFVEDDNAVFEYGDISVWNEDKIWKFDVWLQISVRFDFHYLHQLQHAFRLLNIEKEWTV